MRPALAAVANRRCSVVTVIGPSEWASSALTASRPPGCAAEPSRSALGLREKRFLGARGELAIELRRLAVPRGRCVGHAGSRWVSFCRRWCRSWPAPGSIDRGSAYVGAGRRCSCTGILPLVVGSAARLFSGVKPVGGARLQAIGCGSVFAVPAERAASLGLTGFGPGGHDALPASIFRA
jgi:hypothetical protein